MRMPWTVLSDLISRKSTQVDEHDKPAHNLISLKIRVAGSEDTNRSDGAQSEVSNEQVTPTGASSTGSEEGKTIGVDQPSISAEAFSAPGTTEHNNIEAKVPAELSVATVSSPDIVDERMDNELSGSDLVVLSDDHDQFPVEVTTPPVVDDRAEPKPLKQPIIDIPQTKARTPSDDMAELDVEIAELRRALSSKLLVQNEQLRQMLNRFPE